MRSSKTRRNWTREETILAFELYCKTPFGKIHADNPKIIELAKLIGRTPAAVSLKMSNLAHLDPALQDRNVAGMSHGSKMDAVVFGEFCDDWQTLSYEAQKIKAKLQDTEIQKIIDIGDIDALPPGKYREHEIKIRAGQYFFRSAVLGSYGMKCCVTGLNNSELLIASHIKPWSVSDEKTERTNPSNGLCLNALHDKAFDKGYITITPDFKIIVSAELKKTEMDDKTRLWLLSYNNKEITLPDQFKPDRRFIEYHNDLIFKG